MSRKFAREEKQKYSLAEKEELGKLCKWYKEEYDTKAVAFENDMNWDNKMKNHTKNYQEKDT